MAQNTPHPKPRDFVTKALFRAVEPRGIEAVLGGVTYDVTAYGDDAVQVCTKDEGLVVAILGFTNGKFVLAGKDK